MPELRQNVITRDWVIIATERAKRPDQFSRPKNIKEPLPSFQPDCPFCPGNEFDTERETYRIGDGKSWKVRSILNRYPALSPVGERIRQINGIYRSMTGVGIHEVVVEHPIHNMTPALMTVEEVSRILQCYHQRYIEIKQDDRIEAIIIFKNHGEVAGTSLEHPHSQIAATPIVPTQFRIRVEEAIRYFDDTGECVFCRTLKEELASGARIVFETKHFVAFIPYAARSPFHLWIFPRRHASSFDSVTAEELDDFALNLHTILSKLYKG
ncbi:MAG: galactose-1-phosphate uridylyltransferase, partial [Candidatus Aureabacteria bacterium]|nr:galactose-1-phosphate uridylyltransferase [Candidatus Auribacterota bacterium]